MTSPLAPYTIEQAEEDIASLRGTVQTLQEAMNLLGGQPTPNPPASGNVILFASGGQPCYINSAGLIMGLQGAQNATFPGITVTSASLQTIASAVYPANDAEIGAVYELDINGNGSQGSTAQSIQFSTAFNGIQMANVVFAAGFMGAGSNFRWKCRLRVICHTTGPTGTWSSELDGWTAPQSGAAGSFTPIGACESSGVTTVDTTANQTIALQTAWGSTTGAPSITSRVAMFKRIA